VALEGTGCISECRLALGAVAPTPIRVPAAEQLLRGKRPSPEVLSQAANLAKEAASPIDDVRGSAWYRREMCQVLASRVLAKAIEQAQKS